MAYTKPTPADLRLRYPAFAAASDEVVQYWLTDAERLVTESWDEADYAPGLIALAAHNMARQGLGAGATIPAGVTRFKSGSFEASISETQARGGFGSTIYGQDYELLRKRNVGGPFLAGFIGAPC